MARISRKNQKVFAGQADADQIAVFGSMKTGTPVYSSDLDSLQSADYEEGWANAILNDKAPYLEEMNGVQYGLSSQIAYILQQGLAIEYDSTTTYYKGSTVAVISDTTVTYYKSITDNNIGNPVSNTSYWEVDSISKIEEYNTNLSNRVTTAQNTANNALSTANSKISATKNGEGNGYIKFSNGFIINWGRDSIGSGSTSKKVSFQTNFSNQTSYQITATVAGTSTNNSDVATYRESASQATIYGSAGKTFIYIAVGT